MDPTKHTNSTTIQNLWINSKIVFLSSNCNEKMPWHDLSLHPIYSYPHLFKCWLLTKLMMSSCCYIWWWWSQFRRLRFVVLPPDRTSTSLLWRPRLETWTCDCAVSWSSIADPFSFSANSRSFKPIIFLLLSVTCAFVFNVLLSSFVFAANKGNAAELARHEANLEA